MKIAIHQPNFIPWLGYFYKIAQSDTFVLLDDVQFTKNSFINRNRIKTAQGELWLTLPVMMSGKFGQAINETEIHQKEVHVKKILNTIRLNYSKAPFFNNYFEEFAHLLNVPEKNIAKNNHAIISWVCRMLDIHTPLVCSSTLGIEPMPATERLITICKKLNGTSYISGQGGFNYQDEELFREHSIQLERSGFIPPVYQQLKDDFIGGLSILDTLFNCGPETKKFILYP